MTADNLDLLIKHIRELRFEWVRYEFDYRQETDAEIEAVWVKKCHKAGIKFLGLLNRSVPGNLVNIFLPGLKNTEINFELIKFEKYIQQITSKYSTVISHWEIFNEQNTKRFWITSPSPVEYTNY